MNTETSTSFLTDTTGNRLRSVRYALEVLGFDVDGDIPAEAEVSKRVKELARANHPDIVAGRGGDVAEATAVFALVNAGADILADAGCRLDWAKRVEIRAEMPAEELSGQFCWNHAADGHAADGHATDGHATDGHATDGMSARAAANAEANAAANAAAAERVTPLVGFLAGLHACVRTATGRRQGAEAALAATEAMRSPFGRRIPAHRAGWRALGALLPAIAAVLVPRLAAITD
ncbi:MAG: J domain-containing protein, partial [Actinomycetia bacterium]|nr:J domain-containing protein [Actinomycetes bacterium]